MRVCVLVADDLELHGWKSSNSSVPCTMPMMRGDAAPPSHAAAKLRSALHRSRSQSELAEAHAHNVRPRLIISMFRRPRRRRRLGLLGAGTPRGAQPAAAGARRPHAVRVGAGAAEEVRRGEEGGARRGGGSEIEKEVEFRRRCSPFGRLARTDSLRLPQICAHARDRVRCSVWSRDSKY